MKRHNIDYLASGLVVLAGLGLLVFVLLRITGQSGDVAPYHVYYRNVAGVGYGTPVYYEGYRVGQVTEVTPDRTGDYTRYRVELEIQEEWTVPVDSIAQVTSAGLLSDVFIGISEGQSRQVLSQGAEIQGLEGGDLFATFNALATEAQKIAHTKVEPLLDLLAERLDGFTNDVNTNTPLILQDTRSLLGRLNDSATSLTELLGPANRQNVEEILVNINAASSDAALLSSDLHATHATLRRVLDELGEVVDENQPQLKRAITDLSIAMDGLSTRVDAIGYHLEASSRNMNEFSQIIRRNPGRLLYNAEEDDVEKVE